MAILAAPAAKPAQLIELLDAFSHRGHAEVGPERNHGLGDGTRFLAALDVGDKGLVYLDLVERERTQARERAVAGAKTVHGDAYSQFSFEI